MNTDSPSPDKVQATGDPGDETARRYVYQWTYAAILCVALLDDAMDIVAVFCEHHEDVLLKHADGSFTGYQVKTRVADADPWSANDEAIIKTCARFANLESQFPGRFREFILATNHIFVTNRNTKTCLPYLLDLARSADDVDSSLPILGRYLNKVAQRVGCSRAVALAALKKTRCDSTPPKLDDISIRLIGTLTHCWPRSAECSYDAVKAATRALIAACQDASALGHSQVLPGYFAISRDSVEAELQRRIDGKRLDRGRIKRILDGALDGPGVLEGPIDDVPEPGSSSRSLLTRKLDAGGFSALSIASAIDLRNKADYQGIQWINRFGKRDGLRRYDHIRSVVLCDCADAYEKTRTHEEQFGRAMLNSLRHQFTERRVTGGTPLYDSLNEHLEGFAYVLTGECKVWWSRERIRG